MQLPHPPHPPAGHPAGAAEWAEYLWRYDRYLDLCERQVAELAEYNRQNTADVTARIDANRAYARWAQFQRQVPKWALAILVLALVAAGVSELAKHYGWFGAM